MSGRYTAAPLTTDTEAENSFDLDKSFIDITKAENATTKRRSLFNISVESVLLKPESVRKSEDLKSFEVKAKNEIKDWVEIFKANKIALNKAREKHKTIDVSILSEEKRKFLAEEPDLDRFLRTLHEFQCNAMRFLENDFPDMMKLRENVLDLCQHEKQEAQQCKINELDCSDSII